jgi:hypothetical protein
LPPATKTGTRSPASSKTGVLRGDANGKWEEARLLYTTYVALSKKFELAPPPCGEGELPETAPTEEALREVFYWFEGLDQQIRPHQLRQLFSGAIRVREEPLRGLIEHHIEKHSVAADRDKLEFLLAQYFALRAPAALLSKNLTLEDVAGVLHPVLGEAKAPPLTWYEPLDKILRTLPRMHSLRDLFESGCLEKGRLLKESARSKGYHPSAELAFCHFNFVMRRAFIRLMHEDVRALREELAQLSEAGVTTLDGRRAGLSAAEPMEKLVAFCQEWKPPLHLDYGQASVAGSLEQLLALRVDAEEALDKLGIPHASGAGSTAGVREPAELFGVPIVPVTANAPVQRREPAAGNVAARTEPARKVSHAQAPANNLADTIAEKTRLPAAVDQEKKEPVEEKEPPLRAAVRGADAATPAAPMKRRVQPVPAPSQAELENCLEKIWEQLIAVPPARGRSMATISLGETRFLISSWEVAAFVSESGPFSEDFRRAVVARAMISTARDACRASGNSEALESALTLARTEINYLQSRAEQAKRAKDTETAVNLGITVKRLLSSIEDGEKLA